MTNFNEGRKTRSKDVEGRPSIWPGLLLAGMSMAGCATGSLPYDMSDAEYPLGYVERGIASWYGPGFHGNQTANGERYNMFGLTAAHRTLPMGSVVEVESLTNAHRVTVRINDRGPFIKGRIIDLSLGAAKALGIAVKGTDEVVIRVVGYSNPSRNMGFLRVQVGSFAEPENAWALKERLLKDYTEVRVKTVDLSEGLRYRVLVGQYHSERKADTLALQLAGLLETDTLVIRDDHL